MTNEKKKCRISGCDQPKWLQEAFDLDFCKLHRDDYQISPELERARAAYREKLGAGAAAAAVLDFCNRIGAELRNGALLDAAGVKREPNDPAFPHYECPVGFRPIPPVIDFNDGRVRRIEAVNGKILIDGVDAELLGPVGKEIAEKIAPGVLRVPGLSKLLEDDFGAANLETVPPPTDFPILTRCACGLIEPNHYTWCQHFQAHAIEHSRLLDVHLAIPMQPVDALKYSDKLLAPNPYALAPVPPLGGKTPAMIEAEAEEARKAAGASPPLIGMVDHGEPGGDRSVRAVVVIQPGDDRGKLLEIIDELPAPDVVNGEIVITKESLTAEIEKLEAEANAKDPERAARLKNGKAGR